jgi:hypothetical protein
MDELVDRIVANVGVERAVAEKSVGIILEFLATEGPADRVNALIERLPGASAAVANARGGEGASKSGGMFRMGGIMGVGSRLMSAGLGMTEIQGVVREIVHYAREKAGEEALSGIVDEIPGLSQFM